MATEPLYRNVWAQGDYIYHTTDSGVDVYNSDASALDYHIPLPNAATAVWANDSYIYMGTLSSGVYRSTISGAASQYLSVPDILSNETVYLHGAGDYLCVTTASGVDRYNMITASGISGQSENTHKCFQTTSGTLYYTENNPFLSADEVDLGNALREWTYYQQIVFPATVSNNAQVRVTFNLDFPYHHTKNAGDDIRFVDRYGNNLSYYIEAWHPNAVILVNVLLLGTDNMYMLYGNRFASAQSNIVDAYNFYDQFNGSTLDTTKWQANTRGDGTVTVQSGYVRLRDLDNDRVEIITKPKIPYGMLISARVRYNGGTSTDDFDGQYGYTTVTTGLTRRGYVVIDPTTASFEKAHYLHAYDTSIQGTTQLSTSWYTWTGMWAPNYQRSTFRGETLERTSSNAVFETENHFFFSIGNSSSHPDLDVAWITAETWPEVNTYTTSEQILWDILYPKLHAVYTPNSDWATADHVYEEFFGDPLFLNDLHVTENTSSYNNNNTILIATDRGAHVIEERQGDEENANQKRYYIS